MNIALDLDLRRQTLGDRAGYSVWEENHTRATWPATETALVLCDVWDHHTCRGAEERLERLLPRMAEVVTTLRERGALIIHAPSDTMAFYEGTPARERARTAPRVDPPSVLTTEEHRADVPPQPISAANPCDTCPDEAHPKYEPGMPYPWTREHPAIEVDEQKDAVSDDGLEHYSLYKQRGIQHVIITGVHTNMCILRRSFSIHQLTAWRIEVALVRDLTDAMYNPADPPYVSHERGTELVVEYIEKFWCATVHSDQLLR